MITLEEARNNIGSRVVYDIFAGRREYGTIERVNAYFVFVKYDGDWYAKATGPDRLEIVK